jgi:hypothetical protein
LHAWIQTNQVIIATVYFRYKEALKKHCNIVEGIIKEDVKTNLKMNIDFEIFESLLFKKIECIKDFNAFLSEKYNLRELPFATVDKPFPRIGELRIGAISVGYRFHGRGITLNWEGVEIFCDFDTSTAKHQIIISSWGWYKFLSTYLSKHEKNFNEPLDFYEECKMMLKTFTRRGIILSLNPQALTSPHVNARWYECYRGNSAFIFDNENEIDWH